MFRVIQVSAVAALDGAINKKHAEVKRRTVRHAGTDRASLVLTSALARHNPKCKVLLDTNHNTQQDSGSGGCVPFILVIWFRCMWGVQFKISRQ